MAMTELPARVWRTLRRMARAPETFPNAACRAALRFAAAFTVGRTISIETRFSAEAAAIFRDASAILSAGQRGNESESVDRCVFTIERGAAASLESAIDRCAARLDRDRMLLILAFTAHDCDAVMRILKTRVPIVRCFAPNAAAEGPVVEMALGAPAHVAAGWSVVIGTNDERWRHSRLHIGSGPLALDGWINIDNQPYAGVDFRWDVSDGIPFAGAELIFAEHFLEHLAYTEAAEFVSACRRTLSPSGTLRLSTPNLDWVWTIAYRPSAWQNGEDAQRDCFTINRAFRGWGHQFLYNRATLTALLQNGGFADVVFRAYGESPIARLRNLERHPRDLDDPSNPHVLVVEASGVRSADEVQGEAFIAEYVRDAGVR